MNDTKWRECWHVFASLGTRFHFAYAQDAEWNEANSKRVPVRPIASLPRVTGSIG